MKTRPMPQSRIPILVSKWDGVPYAGDKLSDKAHELKMRWRVAKIAEVLPTCSLPTHRVATSEDGPAAIFLAIDMGKGV
jgi:hypothetical protein